MEEDYVMIPGSGTKMIIRDVKKEIETAFLDYSMSVIVAVDDVVGWHCEGSERAVPFSDDGRIPCAPFLI